MLARGRTFAISSSFAVVAMLAAAGAAQAGTCNKTSQLAFQACKSEIQDDYLIGLGQCENFTDSAVMQACRAAVKSEKADGAEECAETLVARNDICDLLGEAAYDPLIDPANFRDKAGIVANPNPYFPLIPGTTWIYAGGGETITVTVTDQTKIILGIEAMVVRDTVELAGQVIEDTFDWYAQDLQGNVWYFGEITQEFENGELVGIEGSWTAGVDGAKPGIQAFANPVVGVTYRQEWALGDAEDLATVESITAGGSVPAADCNGACLQTTDFLPFEPDNIESKFYAPGIGFILEIGPDGERLELIQVIHPVN